MLIERKKKLERLAEARDGIEVSHPVQADAAVVFEHASKLGHEGIVVERKDLPYESGRSKR